MNRNRFTPGKWLIAAVTIVAVVSMIVVVYQTLKPPPTPQIDPLYSRSRSSEKSRGDRLGGRSAELPVDGKSNREK